ncbi:MAG: carboxypeptidase-like regulatory domain-containing protein [Chitinophagales bacterium]
MTRSSNICTILMVAVFTLLCTQSCTKEDLNYTQVTEQQITTASKDDNTIHYPTISIGNEDETIMTTTSDMKVVNPNNQPVSNATVTITHTTISNLTDDETTDTYGIAFFQNVLIGEYYVEVSVNNTTVAIDQITEIRPNEFTLQLLE